MKTVTMAVFWTGAILVFFCLGVTKGAAVPCNNGGEVDLTTTSTPESTTGNSTTIPPAEDASTTTAVSPSSTTTTTPSTTSPSTSTTTSTTDSSTHSTTTTTTTTATTTTPSTTTTTTSTPSTTKPSTTEPSTTTTTTFTPSTTEPSTTAKTTSTPSTTSPTTTTVSSTTLSSTVLPTSTSDWTSTTESTTYSTSTTTTTTFWSTDSSSTTMSSTTDPCATTSPPTGSQPNNRPQFSTLQGAYPTYAKYPADAQKLKTDMGLPDWLFANGRPNTCAIRMSKAFHDAGLGIDRSKVGNCGTKTAGVNGKGKQYIIRALFFQCYLRAIWGEADITGIESADEIGCVQGVIIFSGCTGFGQHIDLWDGSACSMGCDYFDVCSSVEIYILP